MPKLLITPTAMKYLTVPFLLFVVHLLLLQSPTISSLSIPSRNPPHGNFLGVHKTTVRITNTESAKLTVHCKSKEDDLGAHELAKGAFYEFKFMPDVILLKTQFFCGFQWTGQPLRHFDVYIEERDVEVCTFCPWLAKLNGPCLQLDYSKCYPWNPSPKH